MITGDLLNIHPSELKFPFELRKQNSCSMQLTNRADEYIAFKVKTTNPKKYCVSPNTGIVLPRSTCNVTLTMQAPKEAPPNMQCKDKFLLQAVVVPNGATNKDLTPEMFNKAEKKTVEEFKLRVVYVLANPPSPVPEESEEGSSPRAEDESHNSSESLSMISKLIDEKAAALKQGQKLQQELDLLRKEVAKSRKGGFSILVLMLVGIASFVIGLIKHSW